MLREAAADKRDVHLAGLSKGAPWITARMTYRNELFRFILLLVFLLVSLASMFVTNDPGWLAPPRLLMSLAIVSAIGLIVYGTHADKRDWRLIKEDL